MRKTPVEEEDFNRLQERDPGDGDEAQIQPAVVSPVLVPVEGERTSQEGNEQRRRDDRSTLGTGRHSPQAAHTPSRTAAVVQEPCYRIRLPSQPGNPLKRQREVVGICVQQGRFERAM